MTKSRLLMISPREYERAIWRCGQVEFEDLLVGLDHVDLIAPRALVRGEGLFARQARRVAQRVAGAELTFKPSIEPVKLSGDYELFCFYAGQPEDLLMLDALPNWRSRFHKAVCFLDEVWIEDLKWDYWLKRLEGFDLLAVMFYNTVEALAARTSVRCAWVPPGIDTLRFFPGLKPPPRSIDVHAMGRRSDATHRALLDGARAHDWTYLFDTIDPIRVRDRLQDHRQQLAELVKRSRYFLANKAKVDSPHQRGTQEELGFRSFEGAAGGAVLLGDTPLSPSLQQLFDWPDAHIHVPFDSTDIAVVIATLDTDPERVAAISRANVVNSLRRHDWVYRWRDVLQMLGLTPTTRVDQRMEELNELADAYEAGRECALGLAEVGSVQRAR